MENINVKELMLDTFTEPSYFVNYYKIDRPGTTIGNDSRSPQIKKSNKLLCWKIENEKLICIKKKDIGFLFDKTSYIFQWYFDFSVDDKLSEEILIYYWKGQHAVKGYTPLPPELEESFPVERIVQWSEPALFFYGLVSKMVFSGNEGVFDFDAPHLLIARGELLDEIHFYEVACRKESLRSKASFILILPKENSFCYWHGSQVSVQHRQRIFKFCHPHIYLKQWKTCWSNYDVFEMEEGKEIKIFKDTVQGDYLQFFHLQLEAKYSPKLFYLNSITGSFSATEVEYPLRARDEVAAFPFLQSHLYTAIQPALFLLDNNTELWLWTGQKNVNSDDKTFDEELKLAKELQKKYSEEKENLTGLTVTCHLIEAYNEPREFKNIFPFWVDSFAGTT